MTHYSNIGAEVDAHGNVNLTDASTPNPTLLPNVQTLVTRASIGNTALSDLSSKSQADGPQFVDGSRWMPSTIAPNPVDPGKHVQGTNVWFYRETEGRVASLSWYPRPNPQDDTSALTGAIATRLLGENLEIPPGKTYLKNTLNLEANKNGLYGADSSSEIVCSGAGDFAPYIYTGSQGFRYNRVLRNLKLQGPGGLDYGNPGTNKSVGIHVSNSDTFEDVTVVGFRYGWDINCEYGHIQWYNCSTFQNYYGMHNSLDGYDNLIQGGIIHGNYFADMTCGWNTTISGMIQRVHLGGSPYSFYQFAAPAGTPTGPGVTGKFLIDLNLRSARFEGSGNAIAYSENPFAHSFNLDWEDVGYAQTGIVGTAPAAEVGRKIIAVTPARDTGYPLQLGYLTGDNSFDFRGAPIAQAAGTRPGGLRGAISVESLYGQMRVRFSGNVSLGDQRVVVMDGQKDIFETVGHFPGSTYGRLEVPANSTVEVIETQLYVPVESVYPILNPSQSLVNLRSEAIADTDGRIRIVVSHDAAPAFSIIRWQL